MNDDKKSLDGMSGEPMPKDDQLTSSKSIPVTDNSGIDTTSTETLSTESASSIKPEVTDDTKKTDAPDTAPKEKKKRSKLPLILLGILIFALGAAASTYFFRQSEIDRLNSEINSLKSENAALKTENDTLKAAAADTEGTGDEAATEPAAPVDVPAAILDAVSNGTYADLQPLMAGSVNVIIGASEGLGVRTPAQAVEDLKYLDAGTDPWNFSVAEATLAQWRAGDYASYFPVTAVVGESANNYVVSFQFDSTGKIAAIFMIVNSELLVP